MVSKVDGRARQGDVLTTYKSQGSSKLDMIRFEDNQSLKAMACQEDLRVGFTRHRATAKMFVESVGVLREIASRSRRDQPAEVRLAQFEFERIAKLQERTPDQTPADGITMELARSTTGALLEQVNSQPGIVAPIRK